MSLKGAVLLCILFNKSIYEGTVLTDWKETNITAIFFNGTRSDPGNYHPVSLTCITCKVLCSLLRDAIVDYMIANLLYSSCQHGFRQNRSCITRLLEVIEDFTQLIDSKYDIDIIYWDFWKAFDFVPQEGLC